MEETNKEYSISEIALILWSKRKIMAIIVGTVTVLTIIISLILPKWYKSTVVILPPPPSQDAFSAANLIGQLGFGGLFGANQDNTRFLAILKSNTLLLRVVEKYNLQKKYDKDTIKETIEELKDNLTIEVGEENQIIISLLDKDQENVADMVNFVAEHLDSLNIELQTNRAKNTRQFIEERLNIVLDSLSVLEQYASEFMKDEGVLSLNDQVRAGIESVANLKAEITKKEMELEIAKKYLGSNTPQIKRLELEIESLKKKYSEVSTEESERRLFPKFQEIPNLGIKMIQIERKVQYYTKVLEYLGPQFEQAKIEEAKEVSTIQIIDHGMRPEKKEKPRRARLVIISFLLSVLITSYSIFFSERKRLSKKTNLK